MNFGTRSLGAVSSLRQHGCVPASKCTIFKDLVQIILFPTTFFEMARIKKKKNIFRIITILFSVKILSEELLFGI